MQHRLMSIYLKRLSELYINYINDYVDNNIKHKWLFCLAGEALMSLGSSAFPYESVSVFTAAEHPGY